MQIHVFASSSEGNCLLLTDSGTRILIDAGISAKRICRCLDSVGVEPCDLDGVLITHEHSDHISGLKTLWKNYRPCIIAAPGTASLITAKTGCEIPGLFDPAGFSLGQLRIKPFETPHDSVQCFGYRIEGSGTFAIATDMGHLTKDIVNGLLHADAALIEANYNYDMLMNGPYPASLKERIDSPRGHLCNSESARLCRYLFSNHTQTVILGHLSPVNNTPETAYRDVSSVLDSDNHHLLIAPKSGDLCIDIA